MYSIEPDVRVSGHIKLVQDLQISLATSNIRAEYATLPSVPDGAAYYAPYPAALQVTIEVVKVIFGVVLGAVLRTLVEKWLTLPNLTITIVDQAGNGWTFRGTAAQVIKQVESVLGLKQCVNCRSLVPARNFCDICGSALHY